MTYSSHLVLAEHLCYSFRMSFPDSPSSLEVYPELRPERNEGSGEGSSDKLPSSKADREASALSRFRLYLANLITPTPVLSPVLSAEKEQGEGSPQLTPHEWGANSHQLSAVSSLVDDSPVWTSLTSRPHDYDPSRIQELYQDALTAWRKNPIA